MPRYTCSKIAVNGRTLSQFSGMPNFFTGGLEFGDKMTQGGTHIPEASIKGASLELPYHFIDPDLEDATNDEITFLEDLMKSQEPFEVVIDDKYICRNMRINPSSSASINQEGTFKIVGNVAEGFFNNL